MWMYFMPHLKDTAFWCDTMGKSKEISQDIKKRIVELHKINPWEQFPDA